MIAAQAAAIAQRRVLVAFLFNDGRNMKGVASKLGVHRNTVHADFVALGLDRFSIISDWELDELVAGEFLEAHLALGASALESRLQTLGFNIQRMRLRLCKARLGLVHARPLRIKRLKWYETHGPDGNKHTTSEAPVFL
jgi:hypothetical protein